MRPALRPGHWLLPALAGGALVGLADGVRAAVVVGTDVPGAVLACLLGASVDAVLALAAAGVAVMLWVPAAWGRRARPRIWARVPALALAGAVSMAATLAVLTATLERRNRLLAGGVTALTMLGVVIVVALLGPALARALSGRDVRPATVADVDPAVWLLLAPFVLVAGAAMVVAAAARARMPLYAPGTRQIALQVAFVAALLPSLLAATERLPMRSRLSPWQVAVPMAVLLWSGAAAVFVARTWSSDLRFLPWIDIACGAAIAATTLVFARVLSARKPAATRIALGVVVALGAALGASESETARKVVSHTGLVGPVLAQARRVLDLDHDGYARLFGGGDCDDSDPTIHPGVLDFPDDGIDQDCDGKDASVSVLAPPPFAAVPDAVPRELNLVLVTIDTVRADHLSCYGYPRATSPHLDALSREGALFVNGWAHAPSTRYSMPAIATGRWPSAITWDESIWWPRIAPSMRTLPEALKAAGYVTGAFYSFDYFSLAERRGFERGVDVYRVDRATLHRAVNGPMESHGSSSREMADDASAFFEAHRTQKFFLWVHFYDPHLSYEPHVEVPSFGDSRMDLYDGEIAFTDLHLGRMFARLRELGLWDHTAVVVTGDHGEGFGEHGVTEHGFDLYQAQTKVPLIVRVPGLTPGRIVAPAGHVDLAPTLLNLARGSAEPAFLGRSLVPELSGRDASPAAVFQEVTSERGKKRALVTKDWHLIWNWTPENTTECYDLAHDPQELHDRWGRASADECVRLKGQLQGMVSALSVPSGMAARLKESVFAPGATVPQPAVRLGATVGDRVDVVGYSLASATVSPGGEADLTLLFESRQPVTPGWRFFFHVMGPAGMFRNLDHVPVDGVLPVELWRKGQRIVDHVKIAFPVGTPAGDYRLITGLYKGNQRLPIAPAALSDGNSALKVVTIQVR